MFPFIFALMHFTCHDVPATSIPPPHHLTSPPQSHVAIAMAIAHAVRLLTAASLRPLAFRQKGVLWRQCNPTTRQGSVAKKWGGYRGRKGGRVEGGTADLLVTALWCYATSCTYTHAHILSGDKHTRTALFFFLISQTHDWKLCIAMLNQHKLQMKSLSTDYKMT